MPIVPPNLIECQRCRGYWNGDVSKACPKCGPDKVVEAPSEPTEHQNRWAKGEEIQLHSLFKQELERRGVHYIHASPVHKSTIRKGAFDFTLLALGTDGICRGCAIEFKADGGKLSEAQLDEQADMNRKGIPNLVAYNFEQAVNFLKEALKI